MGQNTQEEARTPGAAALAVVNESGAPREYSEAEKVTTVLLATLVGVAEAARQRDIPASTIYTWLSHMGGVEAMRKAASDTLASTEYAVAIEVCQEIRKRLGVMSEKGLVDFLRLANAGARGPADDQDAPSGQRTAPVYIQLNNGRGGYDTLPVPADPE